MAVQTREELLKKITRSADRLKKVNEAAQTRARIRGTGEESLSPSPEFTSFPSPTITGERPR